MHKILSSLKSGLTTHGITIHKPTIVAGWQNSFFDSKSKKTKRCLILIFPEFYLLKVKVRNYKKLVAFIVLLK